MSQLERVEQTPKSTLSPRTSPEEALADGDHETLLHAEPLPEHRDDDSSLSDDSVDDDTEYFYDKACVNAPAGVLEWGGGVTSEHDTINDFTTPHDPCDVVYMPEPSEDKYDESAAGAGQQAAHLDASTIYRRRRDVRAARGRLGEQFEQLRRVLPEPPAGVELAAKAQVLEHSLHVIQELMKRATDLAMELAVVTPQATRQWVRQCADDGRKPLEESVVAVMKLFAARRGWRYAEWWTLDEKKIVDAEEDEEEAREGERDGEKAKGAHGEGKSGWGVGVNGGDEAEREKPAGVLDDPTNVHGCVVRDTVSVMRLGWTLFQRDAGRVAEKSGADFGEEENVSQFAQKSRGFEFHPREGMPGRVWTSRRAEWLIDLEDQEIFMRSPLAKQFGMKSCLAVPIQFGGHVHSIMAFYSNKMRGYTPECYDLACLLARCLEEVYAPSDTGPWQISMEPLFPAVV